MSNRNQSFGGYKASGRRGLHGWPGFFGGLALFGIGLAITIGTYSAASSGGTYVISWGPMLVGVIWMIRGLAGVASNRGQSAMQGGMPPFPGAPAQGYGQFVGGAAPGAGIPGNMPPGAGYPGNAGQGYGAAGQGYGDTGQGFGAAGQGYGAAGQGYGDTGQGFGAAGQGYGATGQGYGATGQGYGNTGMPGYGATGGPAAGAPAQPGSPPAPNWYADPQDAMKLRWWDGQKWSAETRPRY